MAKKTTKSVNKDTTSTTSGETKIKFEIPDSKQNPEEITDEEVYSVMDEARNAIENSQELENKFVNSTESLESVLKEELKRIELIDKKTQDAIRRVNKKFNNNFGYIWNGQQYNY